MLLTKLTENQLENVNGGVAVSVFYVNEGDSEIIGAKFAFTDEEYRKIICKNEFKNLIFEQNLNMGIFHHFLDIEHKEDIEKTINLLKKYKLKVEKPRLYLVAPKQ